MERALRERRRGAVCDGVLGTPTRAAFFYVLAASKAEIVFTSSPFVPRVTGRESIDAVVRGHGHVLNIKFLALPATKIASDWPMDRSIGESTWP